VADTSKFSFADSVTATPSHPSNGAGSSGAEIDVNDTRSGEILAQAKAKRGRPRGPGRGAGAAKDRVSEEDAKALEALFSPEQWKGVVSAPADAACALTGSKTWELSDPEKATLAIGAANTARHFATFHPKWLALTLFSMSAMTIYGSHFVAYKLERQAQKQTRAKNEVVRIVSEDKTYG
jgi:hypothetical protein